MAAYAALLSIMQIMEQIENHPRPPITLDTNQSESLGEKVCFLQDFLEHDPKPGCIESQIADVACAAEDIIESYIVDQILEQSQSRGSDIFYQDLQKVMDDMDLIKREVMEIQRKKETEDPNPTHSISKVSSTSPSTENVTMVGFDDVMMEVMDTLTGQRPARQILPIIGMGGSGKTTLARNIYDSPSVVLHFDIRVWVTISQEYSVRDILLGALSCVRNTGSGAFSNETSQTSEDPQDEIGLRLYKSLIGRRYLIVLDDMWCIEAWESLKFFFPDESTGSRIMITSRLSDVASKFGSHVFKMNFLDKDKSWDLLCKKVFPQESCPLELEEIGKGIAENCKGLPLSIVVVGGLLANTEKTRERWDLIAENLYSIINLENNEHCLKILSLSYYSLPVHLKPCFLYLGVFPEDREIHVSLLLKLWVAEGFLKPIEDESLEMVARAYLNDLIGRNLVLVHTWGSSGNVKFCKIHDLLRDVCLRQAEKEKFICVTNVSKFHTLGDLCSRRRISIHKKASDEECLRQVFHALQSGSPAARSLLCEFDGVLKSLNFRQLRVFKAAYDKNVSYGIGIPERHESYSFQRIFQLVNSRYLEFRAYWKASSVFPSSIQLLWNLQTLMVRGRLGKNMVAPPQIWDMPLLRHIEFDLLHLPNPLENEHILMNLQTLLKIRDFKFCKDVIKRIPNIKKIMIEYQSCPKGWSRDYCLNNLGSLDKLESLACEFLGSKRWNPRIELLQNLNFPPSLKKLTLVNSRLLWGDMTKIGSLPHLEVLKLKSDSFRGAEWNTVEGEFLRLKFLMIKDCCDLVHWTTDDTHFPCLERLVLENLKNLKEIPLNIGEIPTLRSIELRECSDSAVISAKHILDEQESLGNMGLQVRVWIITETTELMGLASDNFQVTGTCNIM